MPVSAPERPNVCAICQQKAYGYNYDVVSCNACKMFFRRANTERIDERCKKGGDCFDGDDLLITRPRCRACRYKKCVTLGMRHHKMEPASVASSHSLSPNSSSSSSSASSTSSSSPPLYSSSSDNRSSTDSSDDPDNLMMVVVQKPVVTQAHVDSRIFEEMKHLHRVRVKVYSMINVLEDPSFVDLVVQGSKLGEYMRPKYIEWESTERKLKPWGSLGVLLIVETIKTLDVYNELLLSDRVLLLKNVAFKSHHLCIAFDSYMRKQGRVLAPTGGEMFPAVLFEIPKCREIIMDLLTTPMQPLLELQLTEHEFLLLNMIVICNPAITGLSPSGAELLGAQQKICTRLLLQLCMMKDARMGPTRFTNILSICCKLNRQAGITNRVVMELRKNWNSAFFFSRVLTEAIDPDPLILR